MANKKTSEENVLQKSGFNANTIMRLADGSTSDNYQTPVLDFINAITLTSAQAITLLGTPSDVVLDSMYKITTLGITGITEVIISGRNMIQGFSAAECLVTDTGTYEDCKYNVATNKLTCKYIAWAGNITQSGGIDATIDATFINLLGETPVFDAVATGIIDIQTTTWTWTQYKVVLFSPHYFDLSNLWSPSLVFSTTTSLLLYMVKGNGSLADDMYNNSYIELSVIISNL